MGMKKLKTPLNWAGGFHMARVSKVRHNTINTVESQ